MARQLPGLYWDRDKQRYFPLAYRQTDQPKPVQRPKPTVLRNPFADLRSVIRTAHKNALVHQVESTQIVCSHQLARSPVGDASVSAFQSDGDLCNFAGDTDGWFYSCLDGAWIPQYCLASEISSICVSGTTCVSVVCFLPYPPSEVQFALVLPPLAQHAGFYVHPWIFPEYVQRLDSDFLHDVWTADIHGSRLVLGANQQAVMIEDIAATTPCQRLHTHSDVLALAQRDNILYTGLRIGGILRFDTRLPTSKGYPFLAPRFKHPNSITGLKHLRDYQLVASFIDGGISAFDIRFPTGTPLTTFTGNFNQYTVKLPLVTDPCEKFLFAAGQDNRIRLWSLLTGGPALDPGGADSTSQSVFRQPFQHSVTALQVVEEQEKLCLWVASGTEVSKHALGHRTGICV